MYYVYRLQIDGFDYVGCTNNIRRRKDQHNENARKRKSKLGRFLDERGITLTVKDMTVVEAFSDRHEALMAERDLAKRLEIDGAKLLNDNYSHDCTRKGKNLGNTAKDYVVVNYIDGTVTGVHDLRQYCIAHGWVYGLVQRTAHKGVYCKYGCKVFFADEWEREPDKMRYISGAFIQENAENATLSRIEKTSKQYDVQFPDGHIETVKNLDKFAREHNLTSGTLHATFINKRPTKGFQVLRRI